MKVNKLLLLFLCFTNPLFTQTNILQSKDSLDKYINQHLTSTALPGLAIGIVKNGAIYYQKAYGIKSITDKNPMDIHTLFPIASVTKTFTGTLLSTLALEKGISINESVSKFVTGFKPQLEPYQSELSLADILSHRSGWKTFQGDFLNTESTLTDSQLVSRLNYIKPVFPLRTKFGYSNMGFLLAGMAVQNMTGSSFAEQLKYRIFDPLQMQETFLDSNKIKLYPNKALLYSQTNNEIVETYAKYESPRGYGGMYSNVVDLTKYIQMLLDSGRYNNKQVIPYKAIEQSNNSFTIIGKQMAGNRKKYLKTYGLGWEMIQYEGVEIVQHAGAYAGSLSMLVMIPSLKFGVVILTNGDFHPLQETLKWQLIDALLQLPSSDYTQAAIVRSNQRKQQLSTQNISNAKTDSVISLPLLISKSIEGEYFCNAYGKAWIKKFNNKHLLYLEYHPSITGELNYIGNHEFDCIYSHPMFGKQHFKFHISEKGIEGFDLRVDSFIEDAVYVFQRNKFDSSNQKIKK